MLATALAVLAVIVLLAIIIKRVEVLHGFVALIVLALIYLLVGR